MNDGDVDAVAEIIDRDGVWIPEPQELMPWQKMFDDATTDGPQLIVINNSVYRVHDIKVTPQQLVDSHNRKKQSPT